jgi:hypothetical protein
MVVEEFILGVDGNWKFWESARSGSLRVKTKWHSRVGSQTLVFVFDKSKTRQTPDSYEIPLVHTELHNAPLSSTPRFFKLQRSIHIHHISI